MAIKILELHHHAVRTGGSQEQADRTMAFYSDVLGLGADPGRPQITGIPGYWVDVGGRAQVHLMGVEGDSRFAKGPGQDPAMPHVAFAVEDIVAARSELDRMGTTYWVAEGIVGPESQQVFMHDPAGNMIELHQADTCRCQAVTRLDN
jgi:catechol 2,3-dioxygenase-like lactoylglutathione lyase family enzyme